MVCRSIGSSLEPFPTQFCLMSPVVSLSNLLLHHFCVLLIHLFGGPRFRQFRRSVLYQLVVQHPANVSGILLLVKPELSVGAGLFLTGCVVVLQVQQIQEAAATLIVAYSGEKAREIQHHEMEVVNAWRNLQLRVEGRRMQLSNSNDLYRFFSMARDLLNWMTDLSRQMESHEKPRY